MYLLEKIPGFDTFIHVYIYNLLYCSTSKDFVRKTGGYPDDILIKNK